MEYLTRPAPEDEVPNIDCLISVFPGTKKDDGKSDPGIKSWEQPVGDLKDPPKNRFNLKGELVFCTYHFPDGLKEFSSGGAHIKGGNIF